MLYINYLIFSFNKNLVDYSKKRIIYKTDVYLKTTIYYSESKNIYVY